MSLAIRAAELTRVHRERLVKNGFLREVMKGWYVPSRPDEAAGESTAWYASFWGFSTAYLQERFGEDWCLSPEQSLLLHVGNCTVPAHLRVRRWPRVAGSGPGGLVATLLDPQGRSVHLLQCHRFSLCGHWYSPPPPYSNSKGGRCLSDVGREGYMSATAPFRHSFW